MVQLFDGSMDKMRALYNSSILRKENAQSYLMELLDNHPKDNRRNIRIQVQELDFRQYLNGNKLSGKIKHRIKLINC